MSAEDLAFIDGWFAAHNRAPITMTRLADDGPVADTHRFYAVHDRAGHALHIGYAAGADTYDRRFTEDTTATVRGGALHITHGDDAFVITVAITEEAPE